MGVRRGRRLLASHGAQCPSCFLPATARDLTLHDLPEDCVAFVRFHKLAMPSLSRLPPAVSRLPTSEGCRARDSYAPCVLCQQGANSIDHWLSFCQVAHLTWIALWVSAAPEINWRGVPSRSAGVALCYLLFHLHRFVAEYGGLRPVIACVRTRSVSQHVLDLWQRVYRSLPSTLLRHFRAPPQASETSCVDSTTTLSYCCIGIGLVPAQRVMHNSGLCQG